MRVVRWLLTLFVVLVLGVSMMQGADRRVEFTSGSGAGFDDGGQFSIGMEVFYRETSPPTGANVASRYIPIPPSAKRLKIFGGTAAMRPPTPRGTCYPTDGLFRVRIGNRLIINVILKALCDPKIVSIPAFDTPIKEGETEMQIEFAEAGSSAPVNMELQVAGLWE